VASVELRFTPLPEHVRTARLVATAVARRLGMDDDALEEVRLAVGEACTRAVQRSEVLDDVPPVEVALSDDNGRLVVEVRDHGADDQEVETGALALQLVEGLADAVRIGPGPAGAGGSLRLEWSVQGGPAA
jgi:anti-sigma regulatory factor (Ser/Thr protein kinase)